MESWQSDLIEAAATLDLEATLFGEGLPGSFVTVPLGDVEVENMDQEEDGGDRYDEGTVYHGMELMVRYQDSRTLETYILQTPVDTNLHPHISIPYFCWGGNGENVRQWTRNGDWLVLLNNCRNLITQYWPGNAYQSWGEHRDGCFCLRKLAGLTAIGDWSCEDCYASCNFCGNNVAGTEYYEIKSEQFGSRFICESCATNSELKLCPECGDISSEVLTCDITEKRYCLNCGMKDRHGHYYHRQAFAQIAGSGYDQALITEGSTCLGCQQLVPHPDSGLRSRCQRRNCAADLTAIISQLLEEQSDRQSSSTGEEGDSADTSSAEPSAEALNDAAITALSEYVEGYASTERQDSLGPDF